MAVAHVTQPFELYVDAASIDGGMDVYSWDGEKLGIVSEVWASLPTHGFVAKTRFGLADYGPIRGTMHLFEGADGYMQVMPRRGIRRENDQDLYIPLDAIHEVVSNEAVTIAYAADTSQTLFGRRPEEVAA